ncbi:Abi family protein (plasmid) [Aneurinibacillus thermoaerophilus]|uniref:Abi family protein n=1 Tax=Aneurinibacillus thermoaerophilus TaxID=143495 RepID=A0ABX8YGC7_ANETH|nr:Abi family protein [Aneurinibacillus thermoaerophilus]QYY44714.1 Abi family protein [Aneurinibacillus thermoaerophilus]
MGERDKQNKIKPPLTFEEQLELLKSRNLIITNEIEAIEILKRVNYYRLSGYTLWSKKDDKFFDGVSFSDIYNLYEFDRKLRNILIPMLETIEISCRTDIAYFLAHKYGPLGYKNKENFQNEEYHASFLNEIEKEIKREKEIFITHHKEKYNSQFPIWTIVEIMSFGTLSMLFRNLKKEDRKDIARSSYGIPEFYMISWLRCLAYVRNVCAHYGRLYGKKLILLPKLFKSDKKLGVKADKVFCAIYIMRKLCKDQREWDSFITNLSALLD